MKITVFGMDGTGAANVSVMTSAVAIVAVAAGVAAAEGAEVGVRGAGVGRVGLSLEQADARTAIRPMSTTGKRIISSIERRGNRYCSRAVMARESHFTVLSPSDDGRGGWDEVRTGSQAGF